MTANAPLLLSAEVYSAFEALRQKAARKPVDMPSLMRAIKTQQGERRHRKQMQAQTVPIPGPWPFFVTFSIETGHPAGTCRHMSMSVKRDGRVPHPAALWMVAEAFGFSGGLESCTVWPEKLSDGGAAINLVQPVTVQAARGGGASAVPTSEASRDAQ